MSFQPILRCLVFSQFFFFVHLVMGLRIGITNACFLDFWQKKQQKQQQLSLIQSLTEIEKEAKLILKILGLLPPCTYVEVRFPNCSKK